jgi:hypothetical protein
MLFINMPAICTTIGGGMVVLMAITLPEVLTPTLQK